jgi:hypothetical protein
MLMASAIRRLRLSLGRINSAIVYLTRGRWFNSAFSKAELTESIR